MSKVLRLGAQAAVLLFLVLAAALSSQENRCLAREKKPEKTNVVFADVGWDSVKLNNAIAGIIAERVFGYAWTEVPGSTPIMHEAIIRGEIDVNMEEWSDNIPSYSEDLAKGKFKELGINFNDNYQGFYIPRYIAEKHPDLKTVRDLGRYAHLFKDPEDPRKGIIYGGIPGWSITEIMRKKVRAYGLDASYNYFVPGSNAALDAAIISALDKKQPIVAYYWEPTWLLGKYDLVLLGDSPYDAATFTEGIGACPAVKVTVAASNDFVDSNPEYAAFLSKYQMKSALISEALAYMQEHGADHKSTALWVLEQHPELLRQWLNEEQLQRFHGGTESRVESRYGWLWSFPAVFKADTDSVDAAVRTFAVNAGSLLQIIKDALNSMTNIFAFLLSYIPWFVFLALVFLLGMRIKGRAWDGALYALLFSLIGAIGLWEMMLQTLAIVLTSVIVALAIGLPVGVLVSYSDRAINMIRPLLDTMQTMPVFVYLIPALLLFGMGNASAVIATVIYAIVPVIRLTSLGIRQVDKEVVEAADSFGSTGLQVLFKVQIPLALPTIMTGINQTLMMAMSMVVTCSMIGARGLGMEVLEAVNRIEIGRGLLAGLSVVILAIVLDRITQGWIKKPGLSKSEQRGGSK